MPRNLPLGLTEWCGHASRSLGLAKTILQGTVKGERRQGRQRKRWEDNIREWTGLEFAKPQTAVVNREKWRKQLRNHLWCPNDPRGYGIDDMWWQLCYTVDISLQKSSLLRGHTHSQNPSFCFQSIWPKIMLTCWSIHLEWPSTQSPSFWPSDIIQTGLKKMKWNEPDRQNSMKCAKRAKLF